MNRKVIFASAHTIGRVALCLILVYTAAQLLATPGCQTSKPPGAPETFDDVYEMRATYRDSVLVLTGRFMGWGGGECVFPSYAARQEKRSDWIFMIGDRCMYVTGGRPPDLSPMEDSSVGKRIRLDARLRFTPDSRLFLEYVRSSPVPE